MASINMGSILAKAQAHMGSGAGQAKVNSTVAKVMLGTITLKSGGKTHTPEEAAPKAEVNVNVNLDAEYFHWKEGGEASGEKKPEKHSFFSRHHKE